MPASINQVEELLGKLEASSSALDSMPFRKVLGAFLSGTSIIPEVSGDGKRLDLQLVTPAGKVFLLASLAWTENRPVVVHHWVHIAGLDPPGPIEAFREFLGLLPPGSVQATESATQLFLDGELSEQSLFKVYTNALLELVEELER